MRSTLITAFATLGMIVSGALAAVLVVGALEGVRQLPDPVASGVGAVVFLVAVLLAGRVAVELGGRFALSGVLVACVLVLGGGWLATVTTESHGEGLEIGTVAQVVVGLGALLVVSVLLQRNRQRG